MRGKSRKIQTWGGSNTRVFIDASSKRGWGVDVLLLADSDFVLSSGLVERLSHFLFDQAGSVFQLPADGAQKAVKTGILDRQRLAFEHELIFYFCHRHDEPPQKI